MAQILGNGVRIVQPPGSMHEAKHELRATHVDGTDDISIKRSRSADLDDRRAVEGALATEGVHHTILPPDIMAPLHPVNRVDSGLTVKSDSSNSGESLIAKQMTTNTDKSTSPPQQDTPRSHSGGEKGHAHDPMDHELLFLGIGIGSDNDDDSLEAPAFPIMAESPTAAEFNIYDTAYQKEVERIRKAQGHRATVYLTRRVDTKKEYQADEHMINAPAANEVEGTPHAGWKGVLDAAREKEVPKHGHEHVEKIAAFASQGVEAIKAGPEGSGNGHENDKKDEIEETEGTDGEDGKDKKRSHGLSKALHRVVGMKSEAVEQ